MLFRSLEPGEEKCVEITIGPNSMRTLNENYVWNVEPGDFTVYLGENCEKLPAFSRLREDIAEALREGIQNFAKGGVDHV